MSSILNAVEGFNIESLLSTIVDEKTGQEKKYMNVQNRVLWFRTKNPLGKIVTNILEKNDSYAIVEARVYLSKEDDDKNYVAKGIAQREFSKDNVYSIRNIEWAETAAIGRALSLAGFGTQFCSDELNDNGVVDSPINSPKTTTDEKQKTTNSTQTKIETKSKGDDKVKISSENEKIVETSKVEKAEQTVKNEQAKMEEAEPIKTVTDNSNKEEKAEPLKTDDTQQVLGEPTYTKLTPVNEILSVMTLTEAQNTILDIGPFKGKTMQHLFEQDEPKVRWFVDSYAGNNNILKASAKMLVDNSTEKAS